MECRSNKRWNADCQMFPIKSGRLDLSQTPKMCQRSNRAYFLPAPLAAPPAAGQRSMKVLAYLLAINCAIAAVMYYVMPGGSLPTFMPGYNAGSTHIHTMHAVAAVTAAVIFLLIGLSTRR
jgi:hypothetical protein